MDAYDPALASPFRIEWLVEADGVIEDDYARAIAEKAEAILRAARFVASERSAPSAADTEVRVWVEAATAPGCVSVTYEPGLQAFGFHLLDESLKERLACIIFRDLPCVTAEGSDEELASILASMAQTVAASAPLRVEVQEGSADPGVEP